MDWKDEFDPLDIEQMFIQDEVARAYGSFPDFPPSRISLPVLTLAFDGDEAGSNASVRAAQALAEYRGTNWKMRGGVPVYMGSDMQLADLIMAMRSALKLPFTDEFRARILGALKFHEHEARRRMARPKRDEQWASYDLLGAIEARCGQGRRLGREYWFRCPFHQDDTPSLHVDAKNKIWHCFGCGEGGGVREWLHLAR